MKFLTLTLLGFFLCTLVLVAQTPKEKTENLVVNGDFEQGDKGFRTEYKKHTKGPGGYAITDDASKYLTDYFQGKGDGYFMTVDGYSTRNKTVWEQTVNVETNTEYLFSCSLLNIKNWGGEPAKLEFYINGKLLAEAFECPKEMNMWIQFSTAWKATNTSKANIRIVDKNISMYANDFGIDNIKLAVKENRIVEPEIKKEEEVHKNTEINTANIINDKPIVLKNVLFDTGRFEILSSSFDELDLLVTLLNQNESMKISISGHTDNQGNRADNKLLSENRANAVREYLISKGINGERITAKGCGDEKPLDRSGSAEGRKKNRRVEFQMIKQ